MSHPPLLLAAKHSWARHVVTGGALWFLTTLVVLAGGMLETDVLRTPRAEAADMDLIARFALGDGKWYRSIAENGYLHEEPFSDTAMFPAYPLFARLFVRATSLRTEVVLLLIANFSLLLTLIVTAAYTASRFSTEPAATSDYVVMCLGLIPTAVFFRVAYTEAMMLCLAALVLYGIHRRWGLIVLALMVGLATATRPVGVALLPPLVLYGWRRTPSGTPSSMRLLRVSSLALVGSWGLIAFMAYQWSVVGDPLAFAKSQINCRLTGADDLPIHRKLAALAIAEPIWSVYVPSRPEYWMKYGAHSNPLFSLQFANPIYFLGTVALIVVGWWKKWLNRYELLLSAGLLLIPYVTKSYDNAMASFGRFSAVVLPAYFVMGHILTRLGPAVAAALLASRPFFWASIPRYSPLGTG